jgi:putative hemolysin
MMEQARLKEFSQVLIYRESDDDPLGCVAVRDLFLDVEQKIPLEKLVRPPVFVPETKRVDALLRELTATDEPMAVVVDEYGGLAGIVTVEDLLSEVVGEFEPEETEEICRLDEVTCRLSGQLSIRAWRELFTGFLPGRQMDALAFDTLGGLIISLLGRMPHPGDSVSIRNLELTVESVHQRRIGTVLLRLKEREEPS